MNRNEEIEKRDSGVKNKSRKRKRDGHRPASSAAVRSEEERPPANESNSDRCTQPRSLKPLSGLLVAVSSLVVESSKPSAVCLPASAAESSSPLESSTSGLSTLNAAGLLDDNDNDGDSSLTYNALIQLCQSAGATTTAQVHRRVQAVVATPAAVSRGTQRVRKARKLSIPIVSPTWVRGCLLAACRVDWTEFRYPNEPKLHALPPKSELCRAGAFSSFLPGQKPEQENDNDPKPEHAHVRFVDLGCCCACHESKSHEDCPWCADCDASKA